MLVPDFAGTYRTKTDEELLYLLGHKDQMSPEALAALRGELGYRRIELSNDPSSKLTDENVLPTPMVIAPQTEAGVRSFLEQILIVYRTQFWTFFQLSAIGALFGYAVFAMRRYEARQIVNQFTGEPRFLSPQMWLEILLLNLATIFLVWTATFLVFATICSAVERTRCGVSPSVRQCVLAVLRRPLACFRVSLLLFVILVFAMVISASVGLGAIWALKTAHFRPGNLAVAVGSSLVAFAGLLPFSRLLLAVPAVVLDEIEPGRAVFLSDDLTEGKWLLLALLLGKYLAVGYVAAVLPFWIRFWVWNYVHLPDWTAVAASWAAVTAVEPTLFIGLALLYSVGQNAAAPPRRSYVRA